MLVKQLRWGDRLDIEGVWVVTFVRKITCKSAQCMLNEVRCYISVGDPYNIGEVKLSLVRVTGTKVTIGVDAPKYIEVKVL